MSLLVSSRTSFFLHFCSSLLSLSFIDCSGFDYNSKKSLLSKHYTLA